MRRSVRLHGVKRKPKCSVMVLGEEAKLSHTWHNMPSWYILNAEASSKAMQGRDTPMLPEHQIILRLVVAAVLGSIVGIERERLNWVAGLRTHMLVCVGAALFMMVSFCGFADVIGNDHVELDPSRIAAQVVSGIGFLG